MRPVLVLIILATFSAACATPRRAPRTVIVHRAPTVVVYEEPIPVATAPVYAPTSTPRTTTSAYDPNQKNPVPGSAREYINRFPSAGAMAK